METREMTTGRLFQLYGHTYTVQTDSSGKISHVACEHRWPMIEIVLLGDDGLRDQLQSLVDEEEPPFSVHEDDDSCPECGRTEPWYTKGCSLCQSALQQEMDWVERFGL